MHHPLHPAEDKNKQRMEIPQKAIVLTFSKNLYKDFNAVVMGKDAKKNHACFKHPDLWTHVDPEMLKCSYI